MLEWVVTVGEQADAEEEAVESIAIYVAITLVSGVGLFLVLAGLLVVSVFGVRGTFELFWFMAIIAWEKLLGRNPLG